MSAFTGSPVKRKRGQMDVGKLGEYIARRHLETNGHVVLCQNWHSREGEIDLVTKDGDQIVFVEVKARTSHAFGWPEENITPVKRRRLQKTAWEYLDAHELMETDWRIDVIAIDLSANGRLERLEHYKNAIDYNGDLG